MAGGPSRRKGAVAVSVLDRAAGADHASGTPDDAEARPDDVSGDRADARPADSGPGGVPSTAPPAPTRLPHQPALDGMRGLAVAAVVAFHAAEADGIAAMESWTRGGYLGVSAFFTLSGFLIASLLLEEHRSTSAVSLRTFWQRRARRLLPAVLVTILATLLLAPLLATANQLRELPGDALASLFYVANWHFVIQGADYGALFAGDPSPLRHLWSLAVEEQWYLLVPFAAMAATAAARRGVTRRTLTVALVAAAAAGTVWMVVVSGGAWDNRAYMGTDTRMAEMAVGAAAAAMLAPGFRVGSRTSRILGLLAPWLLAALLATWALTPLSASWLYRGGLTAHAVVVAALLVAVVQPTGAVRRLLSVGLLTGLGRISYAVYLFHWPILWWASPERLGLPPGLALVIQLLATVGLAVVSLRVLEGPVRRGSVFTGRRGLLAVVAAFCAVALAAGLLPAPDPEEVVALGTGERVAVPTTVAPVAPEEPDAATGPESGGGVEQEAATAPAVAPGPLRVMVVGDSFAESILIGLQRWGLTTGSAAVMDATIPACAFGRGGLNRGVSIWRRESQECRDRDRMLLESIAEFDPEVVLVAGGLWDVTDRKPEGFRRWTRIGRPEYDAFLASELNHLVDLLGGGQRVLLWASAPNWEPVPGSVIFMGEPPYPEADPERSAAYNTLLSGVLSARPEVDLLDVAGWMRSRPGGEFDPSLRPDGVHFSEAATDDVAAWLGPVLLEAAGR